jgi:cytochrome c1
LVGFGFVEEKCSVCNGVGSIEDKEEVKPIVVEPIKPEEVENTIPEPIVAVVETRKKPGRKPGWKKPQE